jgi:ribosomal protein S4
MSETVSESASGLPRLHKVLAQAGVASRRAAEELILQGRVTVNGRLINSPALDVTANDVVAVDGARVNGAVRDTELVPIGGSVTIALDADNPGQWMFHCHNLYHMEAGMAREWIYTT